MSFFCLFCTYISYWKKIRQIQFQNLEHCDDDNDGSIGFFSIANNAMFDEEQPSSTPLTKSFFRERQRQKTSTTTILVIFHRWKINPINYKIITILYYRTFL